MSSCCSSRRPRMLPNVKHWCVYICICVCTVDAAVSVTRCCRDELAAVGEVDGKSCYMSGYYSQTWTNYSTLSLTFSVHHHLLLSGEVVGFSAHMQSTKAPHIKQSYSYRNIRCNSWGKMFDSWLSLSLSLFSVWVVTMPNLCHH